MTPTLGSQLKPGDRIKCDNGRVYELTGVTRTLSGERVFGTTTTMPPEPSAKGTRFEDYRAPVTFGARNDVTYRVLGEGEE